MFKHYEEDIYAIANTVAPMPRGGLESLVGSMHVEKMLSKDMLFDIDTPNSLEYFVVTGLLRSYVLTAEGNDITLAFHVGPCVFTPCIARTYDGLSLVSCQAMEVCELVSFESDALITLMMKDREMQAWGDSVLRGELIKRAAREHMLAAMTGKARLTHLRVNFPDLEQRVPHPMIASYLGMSAVSLSRLRSANTD